MPPIILGTLELLGLTLFSAALGRRLLKLLRVIISDQDERAVLATALGLGAMQALPFALFALGVGHPAQIRIGAGLVAVILLPDAIAVLKAALRRWAQQAAPLHSTPPSLRAKRSESGKGVGGLGWGILLFGLVCLYLRALCPSFEGDAVSYHLTAAMRFLRDGRFVYLPTVTPTNWPLGLESLYALLLGIRPDSPPAIVHFLFGLLTLGGMTLLARRLAGPFAAWVAVALLWAYNGFTYGGFQHAMTLVMEDLGLTCFITLAVLTLHRAATEDRPDWLRLSAILTGLAGTTKLTGLWAIITMTLVLLLTDRRARRPDFVRRAGAYAAVAVLVCAPWYVKTWVLTGNPVYPILYSVFGGIEWTPSGWGVYQRAHLMYNTPPFCLPTQRVLFLSHAFLSLLGILLAVNVLRKTRNSPLAIPAAAAAIFTACILVGNYFSMRFLLPIIPCFLVCVAWAARDKEAKLAPAVVGVLAISTLGLAFQKHYPPLTESARVAFGLTSRRDFLRSRMPDFAVTEYANAHLPGDARILIGTYEYNLCYYKMDALWPDIWLQDSIHYRPQERLLADLRRLNCRYLVLKTQFPDRCPQSHYCRARMDTEPVALSELAESRGTKLFEADNHALYALNLAP